MRFGCAGIGGYAGSVCDRLVVASQQDDPLIQFVAVCDPDPSREPNRVAQLRDAGVRVLSDFDQLLSEPIDAVWLPLPIDLHRRFTERALAAGKHVMCEKPAAGSVQDITAMIDARDRSGLHVSVGFQDIYQPGPKTLQARIARGEFGKPISATLLACWPRGDEYYHRNPWAGKIQRGGCWIVDSPATNALAHFITLTLFLLGPDPGIGARPTHLRSELYRSNPIDTYDTCCLSISLEGTCNLLLALSHATEQRIDPEIVIKTDRAELRIFPTSHAIIRMNDDVERIDLTRDRYQSMLTDFCSHCQARYLRQGGATLELAREHIRICNGASASTAVVDVPANAIDRTVMPNDGTPLNAVHDLAGMLTLAINSGKMLHETGIAMWTRPAAELNLRDYTHFDGPMGYRLERP